MATVAAVTGLLSAIVILIWWFGNPGYFWPIWPLLTLRVDLRLYAIPYYTGRAWPWQREQQLTQRVDELTRTRRGALDVQAAELRRIERDLHDGAQARLVALSMQLGRAEERLDDRPEVAELVRRRADRGRRARSPSCATSRAASRRRCWSIAGWPRPSTRSATALADAGQRRGLGRRAGCRPVVETAAYFVVAESLTNVAKHAAGAAARASLVEQRRPARRRDLRRRAGRRRPRAARG